MFVIGRIVLNEKYFFVLLITKIANYIFKKRNICFMIEHVRSVATLKFPRL